MSIEEFAADLAAIIGRAPVAEGRPLRWTTIANPRAGGFTMAARWKAHHAALRERADRARALPPRRGGAEPSATARELDAGDGRLGALGLVPTTHPRHAGEIVRRLLDEAASEPGAFFLVVTAGGDGTSLEALSEFYAAPEAVRSRFAFLRLPMGTGNDGADRRDLGDALDLLATADRVERRPAVRLRTATPGKGPFLAFNILSVGLDAFVTHMTNKMKGNLPGDSYKLWVDLATVFYDLAYRIGTTSATVELKDGSRRHFEEKLLLLAFGASGKRTYGSDKRILPDERNLCAVKQMSLLKKVSLKSQFTTGKHADRPEALLFDAARVELRYGERILAQMDGESVLLEPADFPAVIELTEAAIPSLLAPGLDG